MDKLGLRGADLRAFHAALADSHSIRVRVVVLNLQHERLGNLTQQILDGQVDVDATATPSRSLSVSFLDERRTMDFDSDSPSDGALYGNRMLRVVYDVKVPALGEWVEVPIFTGPITKLDRTDAEVHVEAQGKEILAAGAAWRPMTVKKGTNKADAIRRIMRERGGEHRFDFADLAPRLPKAVSLGRESSPWSVAKRLARSMDKQLFYDGDGTLVLRRPPGNAVFTFRDGTGGLVLSPPQVAFSTEDVKNVVWVKGGKPKARKGEDDTDTTKREERGVRYHETAPRSHPLSPWRLGRDNAPRWLLEVVENDQIRSEREARQVARRRLRRSLDQAVDVTLTSLPVPHLQEWDRVRVNTDQFAMGFPLRQFSLPLRHDGEMSVGFLRQVSLRRGRRRNRR